MLNKAKLAGHLEGALSHLILEGASHLQYADDTLVLFEPDEQSISMVKIILVCFEAMSGMKINFSKREVVAMGMDHDEGMRIANLLNFKLSEFPITYHGLPAPNKAFSALIGSPSPVSLRNGLTSGNENSCPRGEVDYH